MARTQVPGSQVTDHTINRDDVDISTESKSLITRVFASKGLNIDSYTGEDSGTGDVYLSSPGWFLQETAPVSPYMEDGDGWYKPSEKTLYIYDSSRLKWLSDRRFFYWFGFFSSIAKNIYLRAWGGLDASQGRGIPIPYPTMTLVGWYIRADSVYQGTLATWYIRKNGDENTDYSQLSILVDNYVNDDFTLNIDFYKDDYIQVYQDGSKVSHPYVVLEFARRGI